MSGSAVTPVGSAPTDPSASVPEGTGTEPVPPGITPVASATESPTQGGPVATTHPVGAELPVMGSPVPTLSEDTSTELVVMTGTVTDATTGTTEKEATVADSLVTATGTELEVILPP